MFDFSKEDCERKIVKSDGQEIMKFVVLTKTADLNLRHFFFFYVSYIL